MHKQFYFFTLNISAYTCTYAVFTFNVCYLIIGFVILVYELYFNRKLKE